MCTKKRDGRVCVRHWTLDLCRLFVVSSKKLDAYRVTVVHFRSFGIFEVLFEIFAQLLNLSEVSFARPTPKILQLFAKSRFRSLFSTREEFSVFLWLCNGTLFVCQTSRTFELSIRVSQSAKLSRYFDFGMEFPRLVEYARGMLRFSKIYFQSYHFDCYTQPHLRQKVTINHCNCIIQLSVYM